MATETELEDYDRDTICGCRNCGFDDKPLIAMIALPETKHCLRPVYYCPRCGETFLAVHQAEWLGWMFHRNVKEVFEK